MSAIIVKANSNFLVSNRRIPWARVRQKSKISNISKNMTKISSPQKKGKSTVYF